jgi:GNAT superfamily N-acetyltransferase
MDIRPARPTDIPGLLTLIRRYWDFEGIAGFDALRIEVVLKQLLAGPAAPGAIWVAESHAALAGYLIVVLFVSVEHRGVMGEIDELFVLPEERAHGTGARLLAAAEAALIKRGCVRLQLQLARGNASAREFYQHRGYGPRAGYELLDKPLQ